MSNTDTAKEAILRRIRVALQDIPSAEQPQDVLVAQHYRRSDTSSREEVVERFIERVREYKVRVQRVETASLAASITAACAERGIRHLVVPEDVPQSWLPENVDLWHDAQTLSYEQLDASDGVLTGCAFGIAQTGTIVLNNGAYQGRRVLTLLPDYHICVIYEDQIVALVPEAITRLHSVVREQRQPITFISGPSATSDIELNRVEGVHGPRTLHVFVVHDQRRGE